MSIIEATTRYYRRPTPPSPLSPHQDWKFLLVVDQTGAELVRY